jgi:exopolysaccharide biosynthesis polyprenyl glycosylphosphotransferase
MNHYRKGILVLGDTISLICGFFLFILIGFGKQLFVTQASLHALPLFLLGIMWIGIFYIFNFYDLQSSKPNLVFLRNFGIAAILALGIGFIFFYISPVTHITPKTNLLIFEGVSFILVLGWRRLFYTATAKTFHTRFAIVCADERHSILVSEIQKNPELGFLCIGTFQTLAEFESHQNHVDMLVIHKTAMEETELLEKILASNIDVIDLAEAYENILYKIPVDFINSNWVIHSIKKQGDVFYKLLSRIISCAFALLVGILTLPISIIIMIAIKLEDGGPILYKNDRVGKHGTMFYLYKFRSMSVDAEKNGAQWAQVKDPRVTNVGRITRKLHIDEIPQMINILKSELTLVGPRPERPSFVRELEQQIPYYFMRHTITPGFTGWAQIKFRYARTVMDSQEKFEYDLYYIKNRNVFLDIGIILKTVQIIFTHS